MKKIIIKGLLTLILTSALVFSCSKQEDFINTIDNQTTIESYSLTKNTQMPIELMSVSFDGTVDYANLSFEQIVTFHNEAMEYIANKIEQSDVCPSDEQQFKVQLENFLEAFLKTKGLETKFKVNSIANGVKFDNDILNNPLFNLSKQASLLCGQIETIFSNFTENKINQTEFSSLINKVVKDAQSISDPAERNTIQLTAKICEGSSIYWQNRIPELKHKIMKGCSATNSMTQQKSNVPWGSVAYADASGAITWGRVGFFAAGGPAGALACGLAGSAGHSALRLITFGIFGN